MTQADAGALNPGSEQYTRWFSLLQQTFGREPEQTHSLTEVAVASFGRKTPSSSFAAPAASPVNILVSSGSQPSLRTVTSKAPTFRR